MKKTFNLLLVTASLFVSAVTCAQQAEFVIDPLHTAVTSEVSRFEVVTVLGRFKDVSGSIFYDKAKPENTRFTMTVKTESYTANNADGEAAVKGPAFLDTKSFPEMTFIAKKISKKGEGLLVQGDMTIHGTTKAIEFMCTIKGPLMDYPTGKMSIGIAAEFTVNRQDFNIKFDNAGPDGRKLVGNEVKVTILALAVVK